APAAAARPFARWRRPEGLDDTVMSETVNKAAQMERLQAFIVMRNGEELAAHAFRGPGLDQTTNVQSLSKSVLAALTGAAIDHGVLEGVDQPIVSVLGDVAPKGGDPRLGDITVDHLLSMRAGLARTSGRNYGRWVMSEDWVRAALAEPFVDEPGGRMLYSTGSYHLLSAMLTRASGRSTLELARAWLGEPLGVSIPPWTRDPQGVFMGGNNMELSPRALAKFGEMCRQGGMAGEARVLPKRWIEQSWTARTVSPFTWHGYGYGWFITRARGYVVNYGWGYGGQMIYVVPDLDLTVVMTSDTAGHDRRNGHRRALDELLIDGVVRAAEIGA
ncbi:MAG: beta-lactamase family protein, partial [Caulobacterales bacterium]|nr:beta-lactamase family protein [Caulobacterales bacterium]